MKAFGKGSWAAPAFGLAALSASPRAQLSVPASAMPPVDHSDAPVVPAAARLTVPSKAVTAEDERVEATSAAETGLVRGKREREGDDAG